MKRTIDLLISLIVLVVFFVPMIFIALSIKIVSKGSILHWSRRIGEDNQVFLMPKFRTMKIDAPQVATHLLQDSQSYLTPIGSFLRKYSIDELPQIYSIIVGDMSIVGPRPALYNQYDLIKLREKYGLNKIKPGITGWAQINGRDNLTIKEKVKKDREYLKKRSTLLDLKIIFLTLGKVLKRINIKH